MSEDLHREQRTSTAPDANISRVAFSLIRDEEGYPPADWEHLWARPIGDSLFEIDNTPFFARGVSFRDVVFAERQGRLNVFREVVRRSGHRTLRAILFDQTLTSELREQLRMVGCETELSHIPGLIAIDVPPSVELSCVRELLDDGENAGHWEYEEAAV